jgi:hypothetical protein
MNLEFLASQRFRARLLKTGQTPRTRGIHGILGFWGLLLLAGCVAAESEAAEGQFTEDTERCIPAERFVVEDRGMVAQIDPDTIDDWRTQQMVPGCRVTAAGRTELALGAEAENFYRRLQAAGWTRTPDPQDAPGEASLRYRMGETDCLFNFYEGPLLFTAAELELSTAMAPGAGELRYNVLALCTPAMEAAPRGEDPPATE